MNKYILMFSYITLMVMFCFSFNVAAEEKIFENITIYNYDVSSKYIVYEYNEENVHYISLYNFSTKVSEKIYTNDNKIVNSDMYFPSISDDGKYVVFTSRATNITNDSIDYCIDVLDGKTKHCNNIYLYDTENKNSRLVQSDSAFNGDNYVARISGNGSSIVFETVSTNFISKKYTCNDIANFGNCINILKYDIKTNNFALISTTNDSYGSNSNSVSPSISDDGRYIVYQSNATNIVFGKEYQKYCVNYITNEHEVCSNIYLVDTLKSNTEILSFGSSIFNGYSGNAIISGNGKYVAYESFATNTGFDVIGNSQVYIYDIENKKTDVIKEKNIINRDVELEDISNDGKYVLLNSYATNLLNTTMKTNLYVFNRENKKISSLNTTLYSDYSLLKDNDVYIYDDSGNLLCSVSIDDVPPIIEDNQLIYILKNNSKSVFEKINVSDNLSDRDKIEIFIDNCAFLDFVGEYEFLVTSVDEMKNSSKNSIKIIVLENDEEGPIFTDIEEIKVLKGSSSLNLSNYIEANDKVDGKSRIYIIDDGNINLNVAGTYKIKVMAKDNSDNIAQKELVVIVYENYDFTYFYEILVILSIIGVIIFSIIKIK